MLFTGLLLAGRALASDNALEWFQRMQHAMQTIDYQGRFIYQVGQHLEPMYILHKVRDGKEEEQLVALNGEIRQVVSRNGTVSYRPGPARVSVVQRVQDNALGVPRVTNPAQLLAHYVLRLGGLQRVAGRPTRLLEIMPKDRLRYGYRLYLDEATGLPLCSEMLDPQGNQLSRLLFVQMDVVGRAKQTAAANNPRAGERAALSAAAAPAMPWKFSGLPPGYALVGYHRDVAQHRQHLIFSDGISVLSLYVEPEQAQPLQGYSHVGVTGIYAEPRMGHQFTAMGDAPADALRMIVHAVDQP